MTSYAFVDAAALFAFIKEANKTLAPDLKAEVDFPSLFGSLQAERVFIYDAYPSQKSGESKAALEVRWQEKEDQLKQLRSLSRVHVRTGVTSRHRKKVGLVQKGVDILLAIDAYGHAMRGNIDMAIFMLNDLDFLPLLEALIQTKTQTTLHYVPWKTNEALVETADFSMPIRLRRFVDWCDQSFRHYLAIEAVQLDRVTWDKKRNGTVNGRPVSIARNNSQDCYWAEYPDKIQGRAWRCKSQDILVELIEDKSGTKIEWESLEPL